MVEKSETLHNKTVLQAAVNLLNFYMLLGAPEWSPSVGADACRTFCMAYRALFLEAKAAGREGFWVMKPKVHMFQEFGEYQTHLFGSPKLFWAYRDEDFVGWVATLAKSRGGPKTCSTVARNVLEKYRALSCS
eukprot:9652696-Alexandrium_andersonii.AAC.1